MPVKNNRFGKQIEKRFLSNLKNFTVPKPFNNWEKVTILKSARQISQNINSEFFRKICRIMGITHRPETIKTYLKIGRIAGAGGFFKKCLKENRLHFNLWPKITRCSVGDLKSLAELIAKFSLNLNQTSEIYNLLEELSQKQNLSLKQLINKLKLFSQLKIKAPPDWKIKKLKETLWQARFPQLYRQEKRATEIIKNLKWPPDLLLKYPAFFEDSQWLIQLKFRNFRDLENKLEFLKNLVRNADLKNFLENLN